MKKKAKGLLTLIASCLMIGAVFAVHSTYRGFDEKIVPVYAQNSTESDYFITVDWAEFRQNHPNICNVSYADYEVIIAKYRALSDADREVVNATADPLEADYTIGQLIQELVRTHFSTNREGLSKQEKLDQSTTIIIAVVVSIFGMSAISVLYILKNKKVIE